MYILYLCIHADCLKDKCLKNSFMFFLGQFFIVTIKKYYSNIVIIWQLEKCVFKKYYVTTFIEYYLICKYILI